MLLVTMNVEYFFVSIGDCVVVYTYANKRLCLVVIQMRILWYCVWSSIKKIVDAHDCRDVVQARCK